MRIRAACGLLALCTPFLICLLLSGCSKEQATSESKQTGGVKDDSARAYTSINPADFFPVHPGTKWEYTITIGKAEPIQYTEPRWRVGSDGVKKGSLRGGYFALRRSQEDKHEGKSFKLELTVKAKSASPGGFINLNGVEVSVGKDDLGVFKDNQQVFLATEGSRWATLENEDGRFDVELIVTYPSHMNPFDERKEGNAIRRIFFAGVPRTAVARQPSNESLQFLGVDKQVRGYDGTECLHFKRVVKPEAEDTDFGKDEAFSRKYDQGFTEDMWFTKGKGLVRLEQRIADVLSMTWELQTFSPGTK